MQITLALHALAHAQLFEQFRRRVFQHAGLDGGFDVGAAALLQHDRGYAFQMQHMGQQQPGWAGADDADLGNLFHACLLRCVAALICL